MKREQWRASAHACNAATHDAGAGVQGVGSSGGLVSRGWQTRDLCNGISIYEVELAVTVTVYSTDSHPVPDPFLSRSRFMNFTLVEHTDYCAC